MTTVHVQIDGKIDWMVAHLGPSENNRWVGVCDALSLTAEGTTYGDLMASIADAQGLLLLDLFVEGELDRFLRRHGWATTVTPPAETDVAFDVPYFPQLVSQSDLGAAAH